MFVYFLQHATEARFKIGKANDLYQRINSLGGPSTFNLDSSLCIRLKSEDEAYRVEKILHRVFEPWNLPIEERSRYSGDTEQFDSKCFEKVLGFVKSNTDLLGGASITALPPRPVSPPRALAPSVSKETREQRKLLARERAIQDAMSRLKLAAEKIKTGIEELLRLNLKSFELRTDPDGNKYIFIDALNEPDFEKAKVLIREWALMDFCTEGRPFRHARFVTGYAFEGRKSGGGFIEAGVGVIDDESLNHHSYFLEAVRGFPVSKLSPKRREIDLNSFLHGAPISQFEMDDASQLAAGELDQPQDREVTVGLIDQFRRWAASLNDNCSKRSRWVIQNSRI